MVCLRYDVKFKGSAFFAQHSIMLVKLKHSALRADRMDIGVEGSLLLTSQELVFS
jgi:hypothetical protein